MSACLAALVPVATRLRETDAIFARIAPASGEGAVGCLANVRRDTSPIRHLLLLGVAVVLGLHGEAALAESAAVFVDYEAPATSCPNVDAFRAQLQARRHLRWSDRADGARRLVVRVEANGGRYVGRLTVREVGGAASERDVVGSRCADVVSSLAFVAALAIDPAGDSEAAPAPSREADAPRPPAADAEAPAPTKPTTADAARAHPEVAPTVDTPRQAPTDDRRGRRWHLAVGAGGQLVSGPAPGAMFAVPVFIDASSASSSAFSPSARLQVERTSSTSLDDGAGAEFTWTAGSLDLCPTAWSTARTRVEACLRTELGALQATGTGIEPTRSASRLWMSLGPSLRGRWQAFGPVFVELGGSLDVPLVRDRFFLEPDTTVFQAPPLEWSVTLALGVRIL